jgi:hypothetical protein
MNKSNPNLKTFGLLAAMALAFPAIVLSGFAVHAPYLNPVLAFWALDGSRPDCITGSNPVDINQCATWQAPWLGGWAALAFLGVVLLGVTGWWYTRQLRQSQAKRFAKLLFITTLGSALLTLAAYIIMRGYSQNDGSHNLGFIAANATGPLGPKHYSPVDPMPLGYGFTPVFVVLFAVAYLLPAYVNWYRLIISQRYIGGKPKERIFE